jgi:hypothetical protein
MLWSHFVFQNSIMLAAAKALTTLLSLVVSHTVATTTTTSRLLGGGDGDYMEDDQGNTYATYSMSWRYLGMYIDCDLPEEQDEGMDVDRQRQLKDDNNQCVRKVMWALVSTSRRDITAAVTSNDSIALSRRHE